MEILASELRIGNWYDHNGKHCQVSPNTILEVWESPRKWVQPIPLTPEILEKCGFEKGSIYFYFSKFRIVQINDSNNWLILLSDTYHHLCKLKHLHQLQNLYFALCGEELNYTP